MATRLPVLRFVARVSPKLDSADFWCAPPTPPFLGFLTEARALDGGAVPATGRLQRHSKGLAAGQKTTTPPGP